MTLEEQKAEVEQIIEKAFPEINTEKGLKTLMKAHEMFQIYFETVNEENAEELKEELIKFLESLVEEFK